MQDSITPKLGNYLDANSLKVLGKNGLLKREKTGKSNNAYELTDGTLRCFAGQEF